jgi:hypothetical protein
MGTPAPVRQRRLAAPKLPLAPFPTHKVSRDEAKRAEPNTLTLPAQRVGDSLTMAVKWPWQTCSACEWRSQGYRPKSPNLGRVVRA